MNYVKPEVSVLGNATALIEAQSKPAGAFDANTGSQTTGPSYDLDD